VELFLWSGNCRPPVEAIRLARELGIENLNGGDTVISRKQPSITKIAPNLMLWEDQVQIYASTQNENVFRQRWQTGAKIETPFFGGFIHARETFQMTDRPRRLKPVNIYYHFYSGDNLASVRALTRLYDWALEQELHAVTATDYARSVRDAFGTRIFRHSPTHWRMVNAGKCRTFRLPWVNATRPDLSACRGVTGYRRVDDSLYVHTDGSPRVELVLSANPARRPYLTSSTAPITFQRRDAAGLGFKVKDFRPVTVNLGGFTPGTGVSVTVDGAASTAQSDEEGSIRLRLPASASVEVRNPAAEGEPKSP